ncbi:SoxR reducing system RseC family protein [Agarivorans sp. QJM3NY_29]|uniref:SoxR reducing system RseC family protein n=1 Tax=unclassified Agarivorans TaxID=2636026 RepID=UPI003D7D0142
MAQLKMQVVSIHQNSVQLQGQRQSACSACAKQQTCVSFESDSGVMHRAEFKLTEPLEVGQQVAVNCDDGFLLKAIIVLFIPPLIGMLLLAITVQLYLSDATSALQNIGSGLASLLGFGLGLLISRFLAHNVVSQLRQRLSIYPTHSTSVKADNSMSQN